MYCYWLSQNLWFIDAHDRARGARPRVGRRRPRRQVTRISIIRNRDAWPPAPRPRVRHPAARPRPVGPRRVRVISFISGYRWDPGNRTHSTFRLRNTQVVLPKSSTRQEGHHKNKRPPCQSRLKVGVTRIARTQVASASPPCPAVDCVPWQPSRRRPRTGSTQSRCRASACPASQSRRT